MRRPPRIAYFSPLPPARTGIADYSRELLPFLAGLVNLDVFAEEPGEAARFLPPGLSIMPIASYAPRRWNYDLALYQLGNSLFHEALYQVFRRYPGIAVLHDQVVHHFLYCHTAGRGQFSGYVREMGYALGAEGLRIARGVRNGQPPPFLAASLNDRILDLSLGLIVHSEFAATQISRRKSLLPVAVIQAPIAALPSASTGARQRAALHWPDDAVIFASVGQVTGGKRLDQALPAFARLRESFPQARYLIVGDWVEPCVNLPGLIEALGLGDAVRCTGFVSDLPTFLDWIAATDVVVNLRNPTVGETSASALRGLAAGRPVIVYDHGWYAELPDEVCLKVPPDDGDALLRAMAHLAADQEARRRMGAQAARYVAAAHSPERAAEAYAAFIQSVLDAHGAPPAGLPA